MTTVSIIVPIYNQEKFLNRSLDSIMNQTYTAWECILVNDGSTDNSENICRQYALKDSRFKLYNKSNEGVSAARQYGINISTGLYTIHIDPDDYVEDNMLEAMVSAIKEQSCDILVSDFYYDYPNGEKRLSQQEPQGDSSKEMIISILKQRLHGSLWNKLIKRSLYEQYSVKFPQDINYCEDVLVLAQFANFPLKIGYIPNAYYHYVQNQNSITHFYTDRTFQVRKNFIRQLRAILRNPEFHEPIRNAVFNVFFEAWKNYHLSGGQASRMMWRYRDYVFDATGSRRLPLIRILILLGLDTLAHKLMK